MFPAYERVIKDGETGCEGFLVIDTLLNNSSCGGLRVAPDVTLEETRLLARAMAYKYAFFGFSKIGGAKAGVRIPFDASPDEKKRLLSAFGRALKSELSSRKYVACTDMGSSVEDIRVVTDAAGVRRHHMSNTGIPTAWSVFGSILGTADFLGLDMKDCSVVLEGFGSVAGTLAQELDAAGCKIVAVSTQHGGVYHPGGLPVKNLLKLREKYGSSFVNHTPYKKIPCKKLFSLQATFLVPGARPHVISEGTKVRAAAIIPAANCPYAPSAIEKLSSKGVICMPDFTCNGGGHVGARLIRYGMSSSSARRMVIHEWRRMSHLLLEYSKHCAAAPYDLAVRIVSYNLRGRKNLGPIYFMFEYMLRIPLIPRFLRAPLGRMYASRQFSAVRGTIKSVGISEKVQDDG